MTLALIGKPVRAQGYGEHPDHPALSQAAADHIHLLNELGSRRRSNTLFRNEQSIDLGVQISYVNVGAGNLTFARRDLVVVGRVPLVFARVYDSSVLAGPDFGPGWRIASAESIQVAGRQLRLLDESGSTVTFRAVEGNRYEPVKPHSSAVLTLLRTASDELTAELQGGWRRTFRLESGAYRLVEVADRFDNSIALRYQDGRLHEIVAPAGPYLRILRGADGLISAIEDNSGRAVRYLYDHAGRLSAVFDAGGNEWRYTYDHRHRLASMTNPEGFQELSARYDPAGRVQQIFANGFNRTFAYKRNRETEVRDTVMGVAQFTQDRDGITVSVRSFAGDGTHIALDDEHQVVEFRAVGGATTEFRYEDKRLKTAGVSTGTATRQLGYAYDVKGRLASIEGVLSDAPSAPADTLRLEYDPDGALSAWSSADRRRSYEYSQSGDLTHLTLNSRTYTFASDGDGQITFSGDAAGKTLNFTYRPDGKLERTTYWDGTTVAYEHDALGTRSFGDWGGQGSVIYTYDRSGNAREILITSGTGEKGGHAIEMDAQQRVKSVSYGEGRSLTITYDAAGNPQRIVSSAGDDLRYEYDPSNRLHRIVSNGSELLKYDYATTERDLRAQIDHKTMRTLLPMRRASVAFGSLFEVVQTRTQGTPLRAVVFDEELMAFRLVSPTAVVFEDAAVYDGLSRMRLIYSGRDDFKDKDRFEQPSNVLFLPPEYLSINCCIPCSNPPHFLCGRCVFDGNGEPIVCYCSPPPPPPPPPCHVPINFRQVSASDIGNGILRFEYAWNSSSGNLADLAACVVGEIVTYPSSQNPWPWPSPPFPSVSTPNPSITEQDGPLGGLIDSHNPGGTFVKPYNTSAFVATQYYRYRCPCSNGGNPVNLMGPLAIGRSVIQTEGGSWRYTVTKDVGGLAAIDPLP
ncbi:MAG: DUF6531 domain-containing protein [Gammaproteobacteria bacterium]